MRAKGVDPILAKEIALGLAKLDHRDAGRISLQDPPPIPSTHHWLLATQWCQFWNSDRDVYPAHFASGPNGNDTKET